MSRITLGTIAARTGLSKFAVSRALSGKSGVSGETRRRILAVAAELGYERPPPVMARQPTIGVVFHDMDLVNSELHYLIQNGIQAEAQRRGYHMRMVWTHLSDEIEAVVRECDGVVLVGTHDAQTYKRAYSVGTPIVRTGWHDPLEALDFVGGTDHEAGAAVSAYLIGLGHRTIAYVHGKPGYRGRVERFYGVRECLERREDVAYREIRFESSVTFTDHLLALQDEGFWPTAFFCAHDGLAVTVVSELLRLGYAIPEDVSVVGYGDYSAATQILPQLTTVNPQGRQIGSSCVRLLDDRIHGRIAAGVPVRILVAGHIIERASSGVAARAQHLAVVAG